MRIISGKWGGRTLQTPKGETTRPTTDKTRQAIFNSLTSQVGNFENLRVLDLYAGSGALGFEALSRGAAHVKFVERDRQALRSLNANQSELGAEPFSVVASCDVGRFLNRLRGQEHFDLVFCDPPYSLTEQEIVAQLDKLSVSGALIDGAIIVYEHASNTQPLFQHRILKIAQRTYGTTTVTFARCRKTDE